jgi:predicted membrane protein
MRDRYSYRFRRQPSMTGGVIAIVVGTVFLVRQSGYWPAGWTLDFWAVVFIAIGFAGLFNCRKSGNPVWALGLIALGVISETNQLGYTHLYLHTIWPVFIIIAGVSALWHVQKNKGYREYDEGMRSANDAPPPPPGSMAPQINMDFVLGGGEPRVESKNFRGGHINAFLGGFKLDLSRADIEGDVATLEVNTMMGGGEIIVPETWLVEMHGSAILGGYDNKTRYFQPDASKPMKRLIIRGAAILGGIEVKNP